MRSQEISFISAIRYRFRGQKYRRQSIEYRHYNFEQLIDGCRRRRRNFGALRSREQIRYFTFARLIASAHR